MLQTFEEHDWIENFRMKRQTFLYLCNQLRGALQRKDTVMRKAICVEKRVAITLWYLATPSEYRTIGHLFGVARSTVCSIVHETVKAIVFPSGRFLASTVDEFKKKWNFPQCAGAIDGSHIPVRPPLLNHTDYYNRKGWYSVIIQAVVDSEYLFRDIYVGWPGSVHDARVFANSSLYQKAIDGKILQGRKQHLYGQDVPIFLVGDAAYPLFPWLMKPFTSSSQLTGEEKQFNYRLSRARIVVENAFGRLKARWRCLLKQSDMDITNITMVVTACCILHNVCEIHGDVFDNEWLEHSQNPDFEEPITNIAAGDNDEEDAKDIRQALVRYVHSHPLAS